MAAILHFPDQRCVCGIRETAWTPATGIQGRLDSLLGGWGRVVGLRDTNEPRSSRSPGPGSNTLRDARTAGIQERRFQRCLEKCPVVFGTHMGSVEQCFGFRESLCDTTVASQTPIRR